jgi:hypothetical protein
MNAFICGLSALEFWQGLRCIEQPRLDMIHPITRDCESFGVHQARFVELDKSPTNLSRLQGTRTSIFSMLSPPIDLLVSSKDSHCSTSSRTRHVWNGKLPIGSAFQIDSTTYVASPEFLFLQLAGSFDLQRLTLLGFELCGSYTTRVRGHFGSDGSACMQATTAERLRNYLGNPLLDSSYCIDRARKAAANVTEISNSPRESAMVMLLSFPKRLGGYGLPLPHMNVPLYVPTKLRKVTGRDWFSVDAFWPEHQFGAEYDGCAWHTGEQNVTRDYSRANALHAMGIEVQTITNAQIMNEREFDLFARQIAHGLGIRLRIAGDVSSWRKKNRSLRKMVLTAHGWDA